MRKLTIILLVVIGCFSCGKATDNVPSVPVNFQAALGTPALSPLNVAGGAVAINGHGVAGLINLFGIESPGLTSSLAIADHVAGMADVQS